MRQIDDRRYDELKLRVRILAGPCTNLAASPETNCHGVAVAALAAGKVVREGVRSKCRQVEGCTVCQDGCIARAAVEVNADARNTGKTKTSIWESCPPSLKSESTRWEPRPGRSPTNRSCPRIRWRQMPARGMLPSQPIRIGSSSSSLLHQDRTAVCSASMNFRAALY